MIRKGDLIFTKPKLKSAASRLRRHMIVSFPQNEPYGHVGIYVGGGQVVEAQAAHGVRKIPLSRVVENNSIKVYRVIGGDANKAAEVAKSLVGKDYSIVSAIKSYFFPRRGIESKEDRERIAREIPKRFTKFFCSTVIVEAYPELAKSINSHPFDIMPVEIMDSPKTKEIKNAIPKRYRKLDKRRKK